MTVFCYKSMNKTASLAERFCERREACGFDLASLSASTKIQRRYLEAMERGNYSELPKAKAYRLAYIKEYANALGIDGAGAARQFMQEDGLDTTEIVHPRTSIKLFPFASVSMAFRSILVAGFALFFAGYLLWQVNGILQPPRLDVYAPIEGTLTPSIATTISGETDPETALTVNGQAITLNDHGKFETKIDLSEGLNTITIEAIKKHGKTSTVVRHVITKPQHHEALGSINNSF